MDFEVFLPCQPEWLCHPLLTIIGILLLIGVVLFIFDIVKENRKIKAHTLIVKRRLKRRMRPRGNTRRR